MALNRSAWLGCSLAVGLAAFLVDICPAAENDPAVQELKPAWSEKGGWTGVVGDEKEDVAYALGADGRCVELDSTGKTRREFKLPQAGGSVLRLARWPGDEGQALLAFAVWAFELRAYDLKGTPLWNYASGIDDVWTTTLNESGAVIVGYNGGVGVHVLDSKGQLRWKSQAIGNVWHVCAGDVWGEGTPQVVTTSAKGQVHVFAADGSKRADIDTGCYANMVRVGKLSKDDKDATIIVAGTAHFAAAALKTDMITALSSDGTTRWTLHLPDGAQSHVESAALAPGKPWLAVGMRDGKVHVIDAEKGAIIGSADKQGMTPEVGWAVGNPPGSPLVLVATRGSLNAFSVRDPKK